MIIDTAIVLLNRKNHWFDSKRVSALDLGLTIKQALIKFKINYQQAYLFTLPNSSTTIKGLSAETCDSSQILLIVNDFTASASEKKSLLNERIVGIGIAFTNGKKRLFGNALQFERKIQNEYYNERLDLRER